MIQSTLDDENATDDEPDDDCDCEDLPDHVPCLECYIDGAEWGER